MIPRPAAPHRQALATAMAILSCLAGGGLILWGGLSAHDPLEPFIASDDLRHLLCFAILGICAGGAPERFIRLAGLVFVLCLAPGLEGLQALAPGRTPSLDDGAHSALGGCAGFVLSSFAAGIWRGVIRARSPARLEPAFA